MNTMTLAEVTSDENGRVQIEHHHGSKPKLIQTYIVEGGVMVDKITESTLTFAVYGTDHQWLRNADVSFEWQVTE